MNEPNQIGGRRFGVGSIGAAAFLASSWTWCIGLFLPVYLSKDFGLWGWVAFAIPNVIGAMAVGLALRRPGDSERFVARHAAAMRAFSVVTVIFHVSFLSWFLAWVALGAPLIRPWMGPAISAVALGFAWLFSSQGGSRAADSDDGRNSPKPWLLGGTLFYIVSLALLFQAWRRTEGAQFALPPMRGLHPPDDLFFVALPLAFGFLASPWLDLTLHRVRQTAPGSNGSLGFILGFGVLFFAMIVASLFYATGIRNAWVSAGLVGHIIAQCVFTMSAHLRELRFGDRSAAAVPPRWRAAFSAAIALALVLAVLSGAGWWIPDRMKYDLFLGAYALVFPAYVWIAAVPGGSVTAARIRVFAVAVVASAPMFWLGGIEQRWVWLAPAIAVPLLAGLITATGDRRRL